MKIKDIDGKELLLTKTTLTEIDEPGHVGPFRLKLSEFKNAFENASEFLPTFGTYIYATAAGRKKRFDRPAARAYINIHFAGRRIGCRIFDEKTFKLILKTAGVTR